MIQNGREDVYEKMKVLKKNDAWVLYDLIEGKKTIGSKCGFTIKFKVDGKVEIWCRSI